jgi:hypothetical protein
MYTSTYESGTITILNDGVVIAEQPFDPATQEPWVDEETAQAWAAAEIKKIQGVLKRELTPLAFTRRFTIEEHAAILTAAQTDMVARAIYDRLMMAKPVDLEDPAVAEGLAYYQSQNLITVERMEEILGAAVTEKEKP